MSDGNKRILGDVWINQENLDRQREFFQDIIESYQYKYGGEFDASTLQGLQASDFATAEQGLLAENALHAPIRLGNRTYIRDIADMQYIFSDAIEIDKDDSDQESSAYQIRNLTEWFGEPNERINLTDALVRIYNKVQGIKGELSNDISNKLDTSTYTNFLTERFTPIETQFNETSITFEDSTTGEQKTGFNAHLVNGLRPILITEDAYNTLKESNDEDDQAIVNDWRNIFIFTDEIPSTYNQPWEYKLTDPYNFRVNVDTGYLQVKNGLSDNWTNVASLSAFLRGANFDDVIKTYIETSNNFEIESTSLLNSLELLSTALINDHWDDYPFLSSDLHNDFVYQITADNNNSSPYIDTSVDPNDEFKKVDIKLTQLLKDKEVLKSDGTTRINKIQQDLNTQASNIASIGDRITQINTQINNNIKPTNDTQTSEIASLKTQLSQVSNQLSTINSNINDLSNKVNASWVEYRPTHSGFTSSWGEHNSRLFYNRQNHTAFLKVDWMYNYKVKNKGEWIEDTNVWFDIDPAYCRPYTDIIIPWSANLFVRFDSSGRMYHMGYYSANKDVSYQITSPVYPTQW